jgi:hypothetical protein
MIETAAQKAARLGLDCCPDCGWIIEYGCGCAATVIPSSRQRGTWRRTPFWLFWKPRFRRPVYAHWNIGGGFDEWEYADAPALNPQQHGASE